MISQEHFRLGTPFVLGLELFATQTLGFWADSAWWGR